MSEVKGSLLGIVLALSVFSIVFGLITVAIRTASTSVAGNITSSANPETAQTSNP